MTPAPESSTRQLLDFYLEAGADALVGEEPVDRFAVAEEPAPARIARSLVSTCCVRYDGTDWRMASTRLSSATMPVTCA